MLLFSLSLKYILCDYTNSIINTAFNIFKDQNVEVLLFMKNVHSVSKIPGKVEGRRISVAVIPKFQFQLYHLLVMASKHVI